MKKTYNVTIGNTSLQIAACNLPEAKSIAQFNKRHLSIKGKTIVKLA
jgi:hypothetical protein